MAVGDGSGGGRWSVHLNEDIDLERLTEIEQASGGEEVGPKEDPIEVRVLTREIRRLRGMETIALHALRLIAATAATATTESMATMAQSALGAIPGAKRVMGAGTATKEEEEEGAG
jgi:hypothetical protein